MATNLQLTNRQSTSRLVEILFHVHPSVRFRSRGCNQFELSHPQTKRLVVLQLDPALQIEVVNGQQEPTPLGWYSPGSCQKQPTGVFRAYLSLDGEKRVEVQSQISIQP